MRSLRALVYLSFILALGLPACREDRAPQPAEPAALPDRPDDDPAEVLTYLAEWHHAGRDSAALWDWVHPETRQALANGQITGSDLVLFRYDLLEGVECHRLGDTALCLVAGLLGDRLVLDSTWLIRVEGRWLLRDNTVIPQISRQ